MREIIVIAHNIRSSHNIGSLFRTCDGFGVQKLIVSGYSPYPTDHNDTRLPHIARKVTAAIHKTALGAERTQRWCYQENPELHTFKSRGYSIVGLEQSPSSIDLRNAVLGNKVVLVIGEEVHGISAELLSQCDVVVEIPMKGAKESFNVSVATGIALYGLSTFS